MKRKRVPKKHVSRKRVIKKKHRSIIFQLLALGLLPLLILDIVLTTYSITVLQENMKGEIKNSLRYVSASLIETYTNLYPGDYTTDVSGAIYKGKTKISSNSRLVDSIKESVGFDCTLYFNGMRNITTIKRATTGAKAIATSPDENVRQYVEFEGNTYFSDSLVIEGIRYYAYYVPLYDNDGGIVGMVFTGKEYNSAQKQIESQIMRILIFSAVIIVVSGLITVIISKKLSKKMKEAKDFLSEISEGNLSTTLPEKNLKRKDEIGDIFHNSVSLQERLIGIVSNIKHSTRELVLSSDTLAKASHATDQTVGEVSSAMSEIAGQVQAQANQTQTASDNISIIGEQMSSIMDTMNELSQVSQTMSMAEKTSSEMLQQLNASNDQTMSSIEKIAKQTDITNQSAHDIQKAVGLIQAIAEETDLLSLNASIEAARAGSAGLGFSVVAEEIRKLADQSRKSASEIEHIIQKLLHESNTTVEIMKEVKANIDHQQACLLQTKENFTSISEGINVSYQSVGGIRNKIHDLNESKNAIVQVIDALNALSQDNAAVTQQTSASTQELDMTVNKLAESSIALKEIAYDLEKQLDVFKM